jgi:hypothetical protein
VAAILLLLYAQPVSRLVRLTIDDVIIDGDQVLVQLGDPPTPVPEPFAGLLLDYVGHRANTNTASNPASRWLFPGQRPGQSLTPSTLLLDLRKLGAPAALARTAAFRQLVLQAPAPVVADALGYHTAKPPQSTSPWPAAPGLGTPAHGDRRWVHACVVRAIDVPGRSARMPEPWPASVLRITAVGLYVTESGQPLAGRKWREALR